MRYKNRITKCLFCGTELTNGHKRTDAKFCGGRCRVAAHRLREKLPLLARMNEAIG